MVGGYIDKLAMSMFMPQVKLVLSNVSGMWGISSGDRVSHRVVDVRGCGIRHLSRS